MRATGAFAVLTLVLGGCLDALVPDHQPAGQTQSGGTPSADAAAGDPGGGGGGADLAMPSLGPDLSQPPATDGGAVDGGGFDLNACVPKSASIIDGHHNAGTDCLTCHNGTTAPKFYVGGTLYSAVTGGTGVAQATIEITDANGQTVSVVTAAQTAIGNFHYDLPLAFPIHVKASSCPTTVAMSATVATAGGGCASCHNAQFQIHLP